MASRQRTRPEYSWGKRSPNEELPRCLDRVGKARKDTLHPGFSRIATTTGALVRAARELVTVMEHCAHAGLSVRTTAGGKEPIEPDAILESITAVNESVGQLAASRQEDFSERFLAFRGALDSLVKLSGNARTAGVKESGTIKDPYSEFAE